MKDSNIRWTRRRLDMSQQEFADEVPCSRAMVSLWELNRHKPKGTSREALQRLYDRARAKGKRKGVRAAKRTGA